MIKAPEGMEIQLGCDCHGLGTHRKVIGAHGDEHYVGALRNGMNVVVKQD